MKLFYQVLTVPNVVVVLAGDDNSSYNLQTSVTSIGKEIHTCTSVADRNVGADSASGQVIILFLEPLSMLILGISSAWKCE